jgi:TonB-dependent Receptor Plug Domain
MMPTSHHVRARAVLLALVAAALPLPASAQSSAWSSPAGADVVVIIPDSLPDAPRTLSELLRSRVPSASVNRSTGGSDAGAFVSLRDASAVRGDDPLLVIDGVRQVSYRNSLDPFGRRAPSILDDVMLDDVARVEVLNGPAAAAAYGYDGQRGVIVVTTRPPGTGHPAFRASVTTTADDADPDYSRNMARVSSEGTACPYYAEALGGCTAVATSRYTPLLDNSPFRLGGRARATLGASGGLGPLGYAAALGGERGTGTMDADAMDRLTGSLRLAAPFGPMVRVSFSSFATERGATLPVDGYSSLIASGLGGGPLDCSAATPCGADSSSGGYDGGPLSYFRPRGPHRRIGHLGGGLTIDVDPARSLSFRTTVEGDFLRDEAWMPDSSSHDSSPNSIASYSRSTAKERNWRVGGGEEARLSIPLGTATATTSLSLRLQAERSRDERATSAYSVLPPGTLIGDPIAEVLVSSSARWGGLYRNRVEASLDQRVAWGPRASVGAGLTRTTTAWRGSRNLPVTLDPHADATWELVGASPLGRLTSLRLRTAYASTSGHDERGFSHTLNFPPPQVTYNPNPPAPAWRPDRSTELEGGFDAAFTPASMRLSLTAFRRHEMIHDVLPIMAVGSDVNAAALRRVAGGELVAEMVPLDRPDARLHLRGQLAVTHDHVEISDGFFPIYLDNNQGVSLAVVDGQSWGAWSTPSYTWNDANGDGRIGLDEVVIGSYQPPRGRSRPSNVASLGGDLELAHAFTISALLDHVGGFDVFDMTSAWQCLARLCSALNDPKASLSDQARAVAIASRVTAGGYVVPGDATRLRELSLAWRSSTAATRLGAQSVRLTLSAYDIASWTRSTGAHPETDTPAPGDQGPLLWSLVQPIPRTFALRVALTY